MAYEVIGAGVYDDDDDDDDDVEGDVLGDVLGGYAGPMGDDDDDEETDVVVGYTDDGVPIVGRKRRRRRRRRARKRHLVRVTKPRWRRSQLAPGVIAPDQGMLSLPLGFFTFTAAAQAHTFVGQTQKPFRGERLLVSTVRDGTTATGIILGQLFVGTDMQQLDVQSFDLEQIGAPGAFGVRLSMKPAQPGVIISIPTTLSVVLTSTDTIQCSVQLLGRNLH